MWSTTHGFRKELYNIKQLVEKKMANSELRDTYLLKVVAGWTQGPASLCTTLKYGKATGI